MNLFKMSINPKYDERYFIPRGCDRDVVSGWAEFGSSVNQIQPGGDYAHLITACPPGFKNLTTSLCDDCCVLSTSEEQIVLRD